MATLTCSSCFRDLPETEFRLVYKGRKRAQQCNECYGDRDHKPGKHYKRRYGITKKQRDELARKQKYRCLICGKRKPLVVDHRHDGSVNYRGLLCTTCNQVVGWMDEHPQLVRVAIRYVVSSYDE